MTGNFALIVAGGRGMRAGGSVPKQYRVLGGKPLIRHTIERFVSHPLIEGVCVVIHPDDRELYEDAAKGFDLIEPALGGAQRQDSCRNGLQALELHTPQNVLIHDAARPFVGQDTITRVIESLSEETPAVVSAIPVADTLKQADNDQLVQKTVDRTNLWHAQTPQGFRYAAILAAHRSVAGNNLTDDAAVAEAAGLSVTLTLGNPENTKVTTADDFESAGRLLTSPTPDFRIGSGFDVHPFEEGDHVILCGLTIPHDRGLAGHSDSDVGLHALTDALLGTISAGDIGSHFPPSDPQWRGVDSAVFLKHAADLVADRQGSIRHIDLTLICEAPKVGPHREKMRARLAEILSLEVDRVSVKATTTDGLGFLGRKEGIAAQATATVLFG